ncbi:MAG TPA: inositol monophosphatase [Patescibacteria group bacterium]|nr:inositol monophosphatase [Patescibacteria group bacterium]
MKKTGRHHYLSFATSLARRAGAVIQKNFKTGMKKQWKPDDTPVTETDLSINQMVIREVRKAYPDHSVLAEEGSDLKKGAQYVWVCDPIDGTIPFSHGIPTCVFSLALVKDGVPVVAVVYDPFMDRLFTAEKGNGAKLNGKTIHVSPAKTLKNAVVGVRVWKFFQRFDFPDAMHNLDHQYDVIPINLMSVIYEGVLVACGELAATFYQHVYAHDVAALKLIVEEAGGKVTDLFGNEQRYDGKIKGAVISNGWVHEKLVRMTRNALS